MIEIGTIVHFRYLTNAILEGEIIGYRGEIVKEYPNTITRLERVTLYQIGMRNKEGVIVDWRWMQPSEIWGL